jgi:hypothetical protein
VMVRACDALVWWVRCGGLGVLMVVAFLSCVSCAFITT